MGTDDDILILQFGIIPWQHTHHIGCGRIGVILSIDVNLKALTQMERLRGHGFRQSVHHRIEGHLLVSQQGGSHFARGLHNGESHLMRTLSAPSPVLHLVGAAALRHVDANQANSPVFAGHFGLVAQGGIVVGNLAGKELGHTREAEHHLAAHVHLAIFVIRIVVNAPSAEHHGGIGISAPCHAGTHIVTTQHILHPHIVVVHIGVEIAILNFVVLHLEILAPFLLERFYAV